MGTLIKPFLEDINLAQLCAAVACVRMSGTEAYYNDSNGVCR